MTDPIHGGFYGRMLNDGTVIPDAPRGAVLNARILWTFSAAYNSTGKEEYLKQAKSFGTSYPPLSTSNPAVFSGRCHPPVKF